ncbi:hypothetical protein GCM10009760_33610 [Kitasatospora kazusensis]|uniref:Uncharacterized protein n=1 Tax=Kitasatospora kazusensis TaxID=407974 RepID=A0ABP5LHB6_9ACTN
MTWYLVIRSDARYGESVPASALTAYLDSLPELRRTDLSGYTAATGPLGSVELVIASCAPSGGYAAYPDRLPAEINLVELICSSSRSSFAAERSLAERIAERLGWEVVDDDTGEVLRARDLGSGRPETSTTIGQCPA